MSNFSEDCDISHSTPCCLETLSVMSNFSEDCDKERLSAVLHDHLSVMSNFSEDCDFYDTINRYSTFFQSCPILVRTATISNDCMACVIILSVMSNFSEDCDNTAFDKSILLNLSVMSNFSEDCDLSSVRRLCLPRLSVMSNFSEDCDSKPVIPTIQFQNFQSCPILVRTATKSALQ